MTMMMLIMTVVVMMMMLVIMPMTMAVGHYESVSISFKMSQVFDGWHMNAPIIFKMSQMFEYFDGWHMNVKC